MKTDYKEELLKNGFTKTELEGSYILKKGVMEYNVYYDELMGKYRMCATYKGEAILCIAYYSEIYDMMDDINDIGITVRFIIKDTIMQISAKLVKELA